MRKYLPALSSADSLLSSHLSGRFRRNPAGGGPDGVAALKEEVENAARVEDEGVNCRADDTMRLVGRARTTSMVMGFVEAMIAVCSW